jgi:DNA repair protein RadC
MPGGRKTKTDAPTLSDHGGFLFPPDMDATPVSVTQSNADAAATRTRHKPSEKPHFHDHRQRLRQRFEGSGVASLADYELLELYLFRFIPRVDTKPIAKALIAKFGSLSAVFGANLQRLQEVDGVGPAVALDLKAAQALFERAAKTDLAQRPVISSWSQLLAYLRLSLQHAPREHFRVLFLDTKNGLIADEEMGAGTNDQAPVYPREVARRALEVSASAIILVHNHPTH